MDCGQFVLPWSFGLGKSQFHAVQHDRHEELLIELGLRRREASVFAGLTLADGAMIEDGATVRCNRAAAPQL
ncbi:hypothetical protein MKK75_16740 [Methylobacterium sp. J-030]|uniref:hypothetical protein n=1 Tax=Methylobacterium sp. J-030 TaxID=2836627 RepID=UPI001FB89640|nr:hypothetical protein [Methylobacterium sp. J-030]MCJ2070426.1 hypothetical protein [Methylobacterium sp. J-030]